MITPVSLPELLRELPEQPRGTPLPVMITGVTQDSRQVQPGSLFVAVEGKSTDGHRHIPDAIQRGAAAVVGTQVRTGLSVPYLRFTDSRKALAYLSAAFHRFPARQLTVIGVTGTDGKTTTANLIFQILQAAGLKAGLLTTVNAQIGPQVVDTGFHVTTPEAPQVQSFLAQMVEQGLSHAVIEATSHGLEQQRVAACEFDLGLVTNITHEHLDYHRDYTAYRAAKARLLTSLAETAPKAQGNLRVAVLNRDDASFEYLSNILETYGERIRRISYSLQAPAQVRGEDVRASPDGLRFIISGSGYQVPVESRLLGEYNAANCLAAFAAAVEGLGLPVEAAQAGIASLEGIPGRMEPISLQQDFWAIVDFAHTPNALKNALETARGLAAGKRVIAVFGSAGLRDQAKRRLMAETSARMADLTVLTAEDPRTEPLDGILAEMASGAEAEGGVEGKTFWRIPDRFEAIRFAISLARPGDVVLACGKGHEQSMCFGEVEYPWDDRLAMRAALADSLGLPGPDALWLPTSQKRKLGAGDR